MTSRGSEKMDEDVETEDHFLVPTPPIQDSKSSFVTSIGSRHGLQTTSTPCIDAFHPSGVGHTKPGCDPSLTWDTPIYKVPPNVKRYGHRSFDTLSDTDPHLDDTHPQINLLPHFEERSETEEYRNVQTELGDASFLQDRHPGQKRRSVAMDKSPSPNRNKRLSLDLSNDSGCFSSQTIRSGPAFSDERIRPPSGVEGAGKSSFQGLVFSAKQKLIHSLPSELVQGFSETVVSSGTQSLLTCDSGCSVSMSGDSAHSIQSSATPSFGEKVLKLQPLLTSDSGCSVSSVDIGSQSTRSINTTPAFGEKVFKLLTSDSGCSVNLMDSRRTSVHTVSSASMQPVGEKVFDPQSILSFESGCSINSAGISSHSDLFLFKATSHPQDFRSMGKTGLVMDCSDESDLICSIPRAVAPLRTQTFEERLALWKTKLDQAIGLRIGKQYVDMLWELSRKSFTEPLAKLFSYLSEEDMCSLCLVSRQWKAAVEFDTRARLRRRKYIQENRQRIAETPQENRSKLKMLNRQRTFTNPNKPMTQIQTMQELPPTIPAVPTATKAEEFFKEARSLDRKESLRKCPICESPARVSEKDRRARCTKDKCLYEFCVFCRKAFHEGSDCVMCVRNPAPAKIGSKQSKQNLRRL